MIICMTHKSRRFPLLSGKLWLSKQQQQQQQQQKKKPKKTKKQRNKDRILENNLWALHMMLRGNRGGDRTQVKQIGAGHLFRKYSH